MTLPALHISSLVSSTVAPRLILFAVSVALLAIAAPGVPIAASVALAALGSAAVLKRPATLLLAVLVYLPLGGLAVAAQLHVALHWSLAWRLAATLDAAVAIVLLLAMISYAWERVSESWAEH